MEIRRARLSDLEIITDNRMEFVCSIRNIDNIEDFKEKTKLYLKNHINDGTLLYYIATENGKIISSCILSIYTTIPTPSCLNGISALLHNVYTVKEYRRKGIASKVIMQIIEEARALGVSKIVLNYTDDGYPLYQSLGFKKLEREMELKL